ncbi:1,6-anhydro-N-acetylmuramyl-L-alanine amidase AmpD [Aliikangiella marina]|uniref:1,6-anhydro-N-acetylmuramyl-L-alanine amidase AmpD n=1 Tax=Aliikangiella marina TaxID=1712262 RepID=A0A545T2E4_9GAMM|nr:1,6-anhydro-N-acetylmuramyl-L-alanine amidase AmpD [Aliikangiella marina]TQV71386.1 1,6-anhydro-N-acetylmuramyl-L-alanine amidase AmpD [Aliikangiella marina]
MIKDGWITSAKKQLSQHFNERPANKAVSLLVIHNISLPPGEFGNQYVEDFFCDKLDCDLHPYFESIKELRVSSHLFIKRDGQLIQFVDLNKRAWHAGESSFNGQINCNDFSVGIELEGTDDLAYTDAQYEALTQVTKELMDYFPYLTLDNIVGHCHIAPERKSDPGESFDWQRFRDDLLNLS